MFGAIAAPKIPAAQRQERERIDVGHVARLEQRAADEAADHEPDAGRGPQQAVAERAAVQRSLGEEDLRDVDQPGREHREAERDERGQDRRRAPERAEPVARGRASGRA